MRTKNAKSITRAESAQKRPGWHERRFESRPGAAKCQCEVCGRPMWFPKSKAGMYKTCGGECASALKKAPVLARTKGCEKCGQSFTPRPGQLRLGQGRFCSQSCNEASHEAINNPDVRARGVVARSANKENWSWKMRGENSPRWRGGRRATYERRKAAGHIRDQNNRRRDFRREALPRGTIPKLEKLQRMKCANCHACLKAGYHLDHITPISRGGRHEAENVQLLCAPCNRAKSNLLPAAWARLNGRLI